MTGPNRTFLTAAWRQLVMLSWRVDGALLERFVPAGTTLDSWEGSPYVSLVGFLFLNTRVLGLPVPFHRNFEEVNLRFYVRRNADDELRRGVCFIREIVARPAIAVAARTTFNEPYMTAQTRHRIDREEAGAEPTHVEYGWRAGDHWNRIAAGAAGPSEPLIPGSREAFIAERHWGYTKQRDGGTIEYRVDHPRWRIRPIGRPVVEGDLAGTFGAAFDAVLARAPDSALLADGSRVRIMMPRRLRGASGAESC